MTETHCDYADRDEQLVAYLYDDIESAERTAFGSHLAACPQCQHDLDALRGVRSTLSVWAPPEPAGAVRHLQSPFAGRQPSPSRSSERAWWHDVPAWAQVAAALFVLGVSATMANLDVRYDRAGLTIRTGWSKPQPVAAASTGDAQWRAELASLASQLRSEVKTSQAPASVSEPRAVAMSDDEFRRRVRTMLDESEKRQEKELALRLVQLQQDFGAVRDADRVWTKQLYLDVAETYGGQILKQQRQINYLLPASQR